MSLFKPKNKKSRRLKRNLKKFSAKSQKKFQKQIYNRRVNVENVFSVIKRKFSGINKSKSTRLRNKEKKTQNTSLQYLQINHNFKMRISTKPKKDKL